MINYMDVSSIITSGVANAEAIVSNVGYNDDTLSVDGADWLTFNGSAVDTIYVSGNSWIGLESSSTENIKINRRDAKLWYLWREEGLLYNAMHFIKIRWSGYSRYNYTTSAYLITYDIIFFETGDILIYMLDVPTSYYTGTFNLVVGDTTYTYTAPTSDAPYVSFYIQEDGTFETSYEVISIEFPFDHRYLVYSGGTYYAYDEENEALTGLSITEVTAQDFVDYGTTDPPPNEVLIPLDEFDLLEWYDSSDYVPQMMAAISAEPLPQVIVTDEIDISDESILGIDSVSVTADGAPVFAVSFDDESSWKIHDGLEWSVVTDDTDGMTADTLAAITSNQWSEETADVGSVRLRFTLQSTDDAVSLVRFAFQN